MDGNVHLGPTGLAQRPYLFRVPMGIELYTTIDYSGTAALGASDVSRVGRPGTSADRTPDQRRLSSNRMVGLL